MLLRVIAGSRANYVLQEQTKIRARVKYEVGFVQAWHGCHWAMAAGLALTAAAIGLAVGMCKVQIAALNGGLVPSSF